MSKSLTEKWKNGKLEENWYYIHLKSQYFGDIDCITINYCDEDGCFEEYPDEDIVEVITAVPSYYEYKELIRKNERLEYDNEALDNIRDEIQEQLKIAKKALKGVSVWANTGNGGEMAVKKLIEKALKEISGV